MKLGFIRDRVGALNNWLDSIPTRTLVGINAGLAAFVGIAHGGALLLTFYQSSPMERLIRSIATYSLSLVAFVLLSSLAALCVGHILEKVLKAHAGVLLVGAIFSVRWAVDLGVNGIPYENFSWTPGLFSGVVSYAAFLVRRTWLAEFIQTSFVVRNLHLLVFLAVVPIEIAVLVQVVQVFRDRFFVF